MPMNDDIVHRLAGVERRFNELEQLMASAEVVADLSLLQKLAREHSELRSLVEQYRELRRIDEGVSDARANLGDADADDELREMARTELEELEARRDLLIEDIHRALVPRDPADEKNVIIEIRGAAGGDEANLFARELFRMYTLYAEQHGWRVDVLDLNETGIGGIKEVIAKVEGRGVYGRLKYESGVHRVQRVPATESSGRIHTSTATVHVLPEVEDVEVEIRPEDLRIDVYRSSGHGGQGVNTTDSAVRITHLPTGIVATCQNERSQIQNRASAMAVLRSRLFEVEQERRARELGDFRKSQVQAGDRSEKIRTYNFPQDRMTDHRINLTVHNLPSILAGNLDGVVDQLLLRDQAERLATPA
jgi:peptide chain release factor 1